MKTTTVTESRCFGCGRDIEGPPHFVSYTLAMYAYCPGQCCPYCLVGRCR